MLDAARRKAPDLPWVQGDLAAASVDGEFDAVVLAGNVLIFVAEGTEAAVVARCAEHLAPGGAADRRLPGAAATGSAPRRSTAAAAGAGLELVDRWATWDREPWSAGGDYQVSVPPPAATDRPACGGRGKNAEVRATYSA